MTATGIVVDTFAGPGGWSEGLRRLGYAELGIELDPTACATARAAGHERLEGDVARLDPRDFAPAWGFIASPPCPAWSMAGKGGGRRSVEHVLACAAELAEGEDRREHHAARCEQEGALLTAEPIRWAYHLRPRWIALEQVPPVLEAWRAFAHLLQRLGYHTWAGVLEAERYGVPQTRERAFLLASLDGPVHPPEPTHHRYVPGEPRPEPDGLSLFGEPLLPWISMAEALGWGLTAAPATTVVARHGGEGAPHALDGGTGARARYSDAMDRGDWIDGPENPDASAWARSRPTPAEASILQGFDPPVYLNRRQSGGDGTPVPPRYIDAPAPTMTCSGLATGRDVWRFADGRHRRLTVEEGATLQGFEPYPWQGESRQVFMQIGNAVPPPLAMHALRAAMAPTLEAREDVAA